MFLLSDLVVPLWNLAAASTLEACMRIRGSASVTTWSITPYIASRNFIGGYNLAAVISKGARFLRGSCFINEEDKIDRSTADTSIIPSGYTASLDRTRKPQVFLREVRRIAARRLAQA